MQYARAAERRNRWVHAQGLAAHSIEIWQGHQYIIGQIAVYLARLRNFLAQLALHIRAEGKLVQDATECTSRSVTSRKNERAGDEWVFGGRKSYQ